MTDETSPPTGSSADPRVLDADALKGLAHPMRVAIYDLLSTYGPNTATGIAERTGESSGVASYHLRQLAQHDQHDDAQHNAQHKAIAKALEGREQRAADARQLRATCGPLGPVGPGSGCGDVLRIGLSTRPVLLRASQ